MGELKLSILNEQYKEHYEKMKSTMKKGKSHHVSNCYCPCECFIKQGELVVDDIRSTAAWNID